MEQIIASTDTVTDVLETADSLRDQLENLLVSIELIQASMRRDDELRM